ncbi:hypothetical protein [Vibrio sp. OPT18]|uniref:hypothetical protein n=1 Tax=Vibrio sp. OPT18 TaxID=2778641 RepID=UPI001880BBD8|nr:hypothetical protein [Vibrio sp. OPT18]MBE8574174.1 hypothetical protein [Vibrio sp. OPT18]
MKKTLLTLAVVATMGLAHSAIAADIGSASFQWAGTVPESSTSNANFWLVTGDGSQELAKTNTQDGVLVFENKTGVVNLVDSSAFSFKVVADSAGVEFDSTTDNEDVSYQVTLASIKTGTSGLLTDDDQGGYFTITANNSVLSTTPTEYVAGQVAEIKVAKDVAQGVLVGAEANDKWQVAAVVAVSTVTL